MRQLRVLVVEGTTAASAMRSALERPELDVRTASSVGEALAQGAPDVLVTETDLIDGSGFDIVEAFRGRGGSPKVIFVSSQASVEACRRALLSGAVDFLAKPFRLEQLVDAVSQASERAGPQNTSRSRAAHTPDVFQAFEKSYRATDESIDDARLELAGHLTCIGAGPSCRTRIVSAAAELFDNVRRHAYPGSDSGSFRVRVDADDRFIHLAVSDQGIGFEPGEVSEYAFDCPTHNGFARIACLAEDVQIESGGQGGSTVSLRFAAYRVDFDEDDHIDLTELDYLTPELARRVLLTLQEDTNDDPFRLSPAMAVAVGRLLAGPDPEKRLQLALWS